MSGLICSCQNTPNMNYFNNSIKQSINTVLPLKANQITTNLDALIYMFIREKYYIKIFKAVENAGKYNKENKRYYFNFRDLSNNTSTKLNSREIWLAKNGITTEPKLKCDIEYRLYQDRLVNNIVNQNKYQVLKCDAGYNFLSDNGFRDYLKRNIYYYTYPRENLFECNSCDYRNTVDPIEVFNQRSKVYKSFHDIYIEACNFSRIINKVNQIKYTALQAKVNNFISVIPKTMFPNLPGNERRKLYSGKKILQIYNTVRQLF